MLQKEASVEVRDLTCCFMKKAIVGAPSRGLLWNLEFLRSRATFPRCNAIPRIPVFAQEEMYTAKIVAYTPAITYCYNFSPRCTVESAKGIVWDARVNSHVDREARETPPGTSFTIHIFLNLQSVEFRKFRSSLGCFVARLSSRK